jgi:hypothetical protein
MKEKAKSKDVKKGCLFLSLIAIIVISIFAITCDGESDKLLTKQEIRNNHINKLIYGSGLNSVNIKLMRLIEKDLNDPNSMRNLEVTYIDKDSFILVKKSFTAKNAFGGTLTKEVIVKIDTLGSIVDIVEWFE